MSLIRIPGILGVLVLATLLAPCSAQSRFDISLPAGMPDLEGPIFANENAVAALGGGVVHVVSGLQDPTTASYFSVTPP